MAVLENFTFDAQSFDEWTKRLEDSLAQQSYGVGETNTRYAYETRVVESPHTDTYAKTSGYTQDIYTKSNGHYDSGPYSRSAHSQRSEHEESYRDRDTHTDRGYSDLMYNDYFPNEYFPNPNYCAHSRNEHARYHQDNHSNYGSDHTETKYRYTPSHSDTYDTYDSHNDTYSPSSVQDKVTHTDTRVGPGYTQIAQHSEHADGPVLKWSHTNHVPVGTEMFESSKLSSIPLNGTVKLGLFAYDPDISSTHADPDVGTKVTQYRIKVQQISDRYGNSVTSLPVEIKPLGVDNTFIWDTYNPFNASIPPTASSTDGTYNIIAEAYNILDGGRFEAKGTVATITVIIQHNVAPSITLTNRIEFINIVFGNNGAKWYTNEYRLYSDKLWDGHSEFEQVGCIVDIVLTDPDLNETQLKYELVLTGPKGSKTFSGVATPSEDGTTFTTYVFVPLTEIKTLVDEGDEAPIYVTVKASDSYDTTIETCSLGCLHDEAVCAGYIQADFKAPSMEVTWNGKGQYAWEQKKDVTFDFTDKHAGIETVEITGPENYSYPLGSVKHSQQNIIFNTNGLYQIKLTDSIGNTITEAFNVSNIDIAPPTQLAYSIAENQIGLGHKSLRFSSTDTQSGIWHYPVTSSFNNGITNTSVGGVYELGYGENIKVFSQDVAENYSSPIYYTKDVPINILVHADINKVADFNKVGATTSLMPDTHPTASRLSYGYALPGASSNFHLGSVADILKSSDRIYMQFASRLDDSADPAGVYQALKWGDAMEVNQTSTSITVKTGSKSKTIPKGASIGYTRYMLDINMKDLAKSIIYVNGCGYSWDASNLSSYLNVLGTQQISNGAGTYLADFAVYSQTNTAKTSHLTLLVDEAITKSQEVRTPAGIVSGTIIPITSSGGYSTTITSKSDVIRGPGYDNPYDEEGLDTSGGAGNSGSITGDITITEEKPLGFSITKNPNKEWTNLDTILSFNCTGEGNSSFYGIREYMVKIDDGPFTSLGSVAGVPNTTMSFKQEGAHTIIAYGIGNNGVNTDKQTVEVKVDTVLPTINSQVEIDEKIGSAKVRITASDTTAGIDYIETYDGRKIYADSFEEVINLSGNYLYTAVDKAGNKKEINVDLMRLHPDYTIDSFMTTSPPRYDSPFDVTLTVSNKLGHGNNIPIKIYMSESQGSLNTVLLKEDIISIPEGTTLNKTYSIKIPETYGQVQLWAEINYVNLGAESVPGDNKADLTIDIPRIDYSITSIANFRTTSPGQRIVMPFTVSGINLGESKRVPVQLYLQTVQGRVLIASAEVNMSSVTDIVAGEITTTIPSSTPDGEAAFILEVNSENKRIESDETNNSFVDEMRVSTPDLGLMVNDVLVNEGSYFTFDADEDEQQIVFTTRDTREKITIIETKGQVKNVDANTATYKCRLKKGESQSFTVSLISNCGSEVKSYRLTVMRINDDLSFNMTLTSGGVTNTADVDTNTKNITLAMPVGSLEGVLELTLNNESAKIVSIDGATPDDYHYVGPITLGLDAERSFSFVLETVDGKKRETYNVLISNRNADPAVTINNATELANVIYGLGGYMRNSVFSPYGKSLTSVEMAVRGGRTNGYVLELAVNDVNKEQYLRGVVVIDGIEYPIRWNSFDGKTLEQAGKVEHGYIYVDRTTFIKDLVDSTVTIKVSDYPNADDGTMPISTTIVEDILNVDIKAPTVICTADDVLGVINIEASDATSGLESMVVEVSRDRGINYTKLQEWTSLNTPSTSQVIPMEDTGTLYYKVTVKDILGNTTTKVAIVDLGGTEIELDKQINIKTETTRKADYFFINTRRSNTTAIQSDVLDTFKD